MDHHVEYHQPEGFEWVVMWNTMGFNHQPEGFEWDLMEVPSSNFIYR